MFRTQLTALLLVHSRRISEIFLGFISSSPVSPSLPRFLSRGGTNLYIMYIESKIRIYYWACISEAKKKMYREKSIDRLSREVVIFSLSELLLFFSVCVCLCVFSYLSRLGAMSGRSIDNALSTRLIGLLHSSFTRSFFSPLLLPLPSSFFCGRESKRKEGPSETCTADLSLPPELSPPRLSIFRPRISRVGLSLPRGVISGGGGALL